MNTVERVNSYSPGVTNVAVSGTGLSAGNANVYADGSWARAGATLASGNNSYTATAEDTYGRTAQDSVTMNLPATVAFTYDANGNLTGDGRRVFEYDYENQLTNVYVASAWRESMKYDAFGRKRLLQQHQWTGSAWLLTNEVRYVYDGMLVVQERHFQPQVSTNIPINTISYTRGNDLSGSLQGAGGIGGLLARTDHSTLNLQPSTAHAYYHADGNGNITALVNTNGAVVARYQYDPYGNLLGMAGPLAEANTYRFSSKEWHVNAGLYYYGFRYYEPNLQRWLNRDPIGEWGGINLYGFVHNDPIGGVDFLGLEDCWPWHHDYPRAIFTPEFLKQHNLSINPHDRINGRELPKDMHQAIHPDWNDDWNDWIEEQHDKKKQITDKSVKEQLKKMKNNDRYKAIYKTGRTPKFDYDDNRRLRGLGPLLVLATLLAESGNKAFAEDYEAFQRAAKQSDINQMERDGPQN